MLFEKIQGHDHILPRLQKNVLSNQFEGAHLFIGPSSVGKCTVARQLAKYLLCTGLVDDTCRCETCRLFPQVPDYLEISKGDDNILTSDIDAFIEYLSLVPYRSRMRVAIIDNVHNLNTTASNNLLKTLEDLKSNCLVILISNQPDKIFPTIVSRCYRTEFGPLKTDELMAVLKSKGHETGKLTEMECLLPYLTGNILVDFSKYAAYLKYVPQFVRDLPGMKEDELYGLIKKIDEDQEIQFFMEILVIFMNDLLKIRFDSPDVVLNLKKLDYIEELTSVWKEDLCVMLLEKLRSAQTSMNRNLNLKLGQLVIPIFGWVYYFLHKVTPKNESDK